VEAEGRGGHRINGAAGRERGWLRLASVSPFGSTGEVDLDAGFQEWFSMFLAIAF
jgi:hypothetical protein